MIQIAKKINQIITIWTRVEVLKIIVKLKKQIYSDHGERLPYPAPTKYQPAESPIDASARSNRTATLVEIFKTLKKKFVLVHKNTFNFQLNFDT